MALGDDSDAAKPVQLPELPPVGGLDEEPAPVAKVQRDPSTGQVSPRRVIAAVDTDDAPDLPGLVDFEPRPDPVGPNDETRASGLSPKVVVPAKAEAVVEEAEEDTYLGRNFGGYKLDQKIGQGGMGVVYRGRQVSLDRVVAIKILNKSLSDNEEFIKRFAREAKSIARITHPHIVAVYDFGKTDGCWYMVTEFVEGSNLARMITDRIMLPVDELVPLMVQCLAGIAHVSQSGIVHRDIKPDNILVTRDQVAKIADFGLAKDITSDTDLTAVGLAMGTPAYMSPEQCMGRKLDVRSDVYALGVTAYFALTGEKPFMGQSSFEIMTKQREFTPPPPILLNPRIPREVSDLVMRMMSKNAAERGGDADEVRTRWIDLGKRLGLGAVVRAAAPAPTAASHGLPPMPAPGPPPPPIMVQPPAMIEPAHAAPPTPPGRTSEQRPGEPPRPGTERRAGRSTGMGEAINCPRCGELNRGSSKVCQKCGHALVKTDAHSARDQEVEANRLFEAGSYAEAAALYARVADHEGDRKQRSVLRSKERESRRLEQVDQFGDLQHRSQELTTAGDLKGALEVLERGLREARESAPGSPVEVEMTAAATTLRRRLRQRRLWRLALVLLVLLLLAALLASQRERLAQLWRDAGAGSASATSRNDRPAGVVARGDGDHGIGGAGADGHWQRAAAPDGATRTPAA